MIFTLMEIFYILITVLAIGYIFSGIIRTQHTEAKKTTWKSFKFGLMIGAPAIILHELGHKFVGLALGIPSHYEAWFTGLGIGILLKLIGSGFIILAPGYVVLEGITSNIQTILTAGAGPAVNLILWLGSFYVLKLKTYNKKTTIFLIATREVNKWLFLFNMIPIPPLDGSKIIWPLLSMIF